MPNRTAPSRPDLTTLAPGSTVEHLDDLRALVTISRTDPSDIGQRQVFARLDDGPQVALVFGQSVILQVQPGTHRLRVHNTLMRKTVSFAIEASEHLEFLLINSGRWWTAGMVGFLGAAPLFLSIQRRIHR